MSINTNPPPFTHHHSGGSEGFRVLPCRYGAKAIPANPVLRSMALCHVALPPHGETVDSPEEKGHFHYWTTELYTFLCGYGRMFLNGRWVPVRQGEVVAVPPMVMHNLVAGESGLELIVWTQPAYDHGDSEDVFDYAERFNQFDPDWLRAPVLSIARNGVELHDYWHTKDFELSQARLAPGAQVHTHRHQQAEEAYFFTQGSAAVTLEGRPHHAEAGTMISIPSSTLHSVTAGPEGAHYYVAATPPVLEEETVVKK